MANQTGNKTISVADLIAVVGLGLLGFFTFMGAMFKTGGLLGTSILYAVGLVLVTALLLWFLIRAKTAKNDLSKFKVMEMLLLAAYVAVAVFGATFLMHYFTISTSKDKYISAFKGDADALTALFGKYEAQEKDAVAKTMTGLSLTRSYICDAEVRGLLTGKGIKNTRESINSYQGMLEELLFKGGYEVEHDDILSEVDSYLHDVETWAALKVPMAASGMEYLSGETVRFLNEKSSQSGEDGKCMKFVLEKGSDSFVHLSDESLSYTYDIPKLKFPGMLRGAETSLSVPGIVLALLLHLLILLDYFSAYRSKVVRRKGSLSSDNGISLYD